MGITILERVITSRVRSGCPIRGGLVAQIPLNGHPLDEYTDTAITNGQRVYRQQFHIDEPGLTDVFTFQYLRDTGE